ncbi:MAG: diguanylate cyclase [bacterium]|nr:diguanylate cyclase [bacterium]
MKNEDLNMLIVDDLESNLMILDKFLRRPGLTIVKAYSGQEALEKLLEYDFAIILLDVQMPGMDGFETAALVRGNPDTMHIPIIFVTAISKEQRLVFKGYESGAVDYILKPFEPDILRRKVDVFLDLHKQRKKLEAMNEELKNVLNKVREQQKAVIEEERLKLLLQMTGASADELDQPLQMLLDTIELLDKDKNNCQRTEEHIAKIRETGQRITTSVNKIRAIHDDESKPIAIQDQEIPPELREKIRILLLEDSELDYRIVKGILRKQEHLLLTREATIADAVNRIQHQEFDLILLDYLLPDGTGFDFMKILKEKKLDIPVAVITGHGDEMVAARMIQAGAHDYLPKNKVSMQALSRIIKNTMEKVNLQRELEKARQKMAEMSTIDTLTKLHNRRFFMEELAREYERTRRYKSGMVFIMLDIDHFKKINDTYGHPCGDMVLSTIGAMLKDALRKSDLAGRYGGEEFAVILPNTNIEGAVILAEKFRETMAAHQFQYKTHQFHVTVSIGIASALTAQSPEALIALADQNLYRAKQSGRNKTIS